MHFVLLLRLYTALPPTFISCSPPPVASSVPSVPLCVSVSRPTVNACAPHSAVAPAAAAAAPLNAPYWQAEDAGSPSSGSTPQGCWWWSWEQDQSENRTILSWWKDLKCILGRSCIVCVFVYHLHLWRYWPWFTHVSFFILLFTATVLILCLIWWGER